MGKDIICPIILENENLKAEIEKLKKEKQEIINAIKAKLSKPFNIDKSSPPPKRAG